MNPSTNKRLINASDNQGLLISENETLLKVLVEQVGDLASSNLLQFTEQIVNEVIFESNVDGVRYCLVRCLPKSQEKFSLSPREQAIAKLVAQGLPNKLIAIRLSISPWTVATHLRRIFVKLGVTSRTAMITCLLEKDLLRD